MIPEELRAPLDPEVHILDSGVNYRTSQVAFAWLMFFTSITHRLDGFLRRYHRVHPQFAYLVGEIFGRLYQNRTPQRDDREDTLIKGLGGVLHGILDETTEMKNLQRVCNGDPMTARLALLTMLDAIDKLKLPNSSEEEDKEVEDLFGRGEGKDEKEEGEKEEEGDPSPDPEGGKERDYQDLRDWVESHSSPGESRAKARKEVQKGASNAKEAAYEAKEAFGNAFGDEPGEVFRSDKGAALQFQDHLLTNKALREMMKLLGSWRSSILKKHQDEFIPAPTQVMGFEMTSKWRNLTAASRALLMHPPTRKMMIAKVIKGQAGGWRRGEMVGQEQGCVYILIDASGSMQGPSLNQAAAFAGAMCVLAHRGKRDVKVAAFNTEVTPVPVDLKSTRTIGESLVNLTRLVASGGTNFSPALSSFLDLPPAWRKKADIVLISDGCGDLDAPILEAVQRQASLTYLVVKGGRIHGMLGERADQVVRGCDLLNPDEATSRAASKALRGLRR